MSELLVITPLSAKQINCGGFWSGSGTKIIEISATLPTPNLQMSMSGLERAVRMDVYQPPV